MNAVIGAFTQEGWRDSNRAHGSSSNCLFSLSPELKIIRSRDNSAGAFQWLNTATYGAPHGLALGGSSMKGDADTFRLFIPDSLEGCVVRFSCLTYEPGNLLEGVSISTTATSTTTVFPSSSSSSSSSSYQQPQKIASDHEKNFEIECIEIWACGGDEALVKGFQSQTEARQIKQNTIDKARKVDKAQFFGNAFDREFLLSNTVNQHGSSQNGNDR